MNIHVPDRRTVASILVTLPLLAGIASPFVPMVLQAFTDVGRDTEPVVPAYESGPILPEIRRDVRSPPGSGRVSFPAVPVR